MRYDKLLDKRAVWITGGREQAAWEYVSLFAEHGAARVTLIGAETEPRGRDQELRECELELLECDLTDPAAAGELCAGLAARGNVPDVWVHIADIFGTAYIDELDLADFNRMLNISVVTPFEIMGRVAGAMAARGGGSVVFVSGHYGVQGSDRTSAYGAAKGGEISLAVSLAMEYAGDGIRVNSVVPGVSWLDAGDSLLARSGEADTPDFWWPVHPLKRRVRPDEVANAALFLASGMASYVTGETLLLDGAGHLIAHNHNFPRKDKVMP